jgi:hypothetical protein
MVRINSEIWTLSFFMSEKAWKVGLTGNHFEWRKNMRKFGLCHFLCRKKCGNNSELYSESPATGYPGSWIMTSPVIIQYRNCMFLFDYIVYYYILFILDYRYIVYFLL